MQIGKDGQFRPVLDEPADEPAVETEEPAEQEDERG